MSYIANGSVIVENNTTPLLNGETFNSIISDTNGYVGVQSNIICDQPFTISLTFYNDAAGTDVVETFTQVVNLNVASNTKSRYFEAIPPRGRYYGISVENTSGDNMLQTDVEIRLAMTAPPLTQIPISSTFRDGTVAAAVQSVIKGKDLDGTYVNATVNADGALKVTNFALETAISNDGVYSTGTKFGRNADIDTGTVPEDVWNGGGLYTGFNCVTAQILETNSSSASDVGQLRTSGTISTASETQVITTGGSFLTNVQVGDLFINDTAQFHGVVKSIEDNNTLTVHLFTNLDEFGRLSTTVGDSFRIARATSTGAAVVKISQMLDGDYNPQTEYIILNGTTRVDTVGTYIRQARGQVITAGTALANVGEINTRQKTTTANVTMVMPEGGGQSAICCDTVPKGVIWIIENIDIQISRASGAAGSANCRFQVRKIGEAWQTKAFPAVTNSSPFNIEYTGGIVLEPKTDVRWSVQSVSDNSNIITADFQYFQRDKPTNV